VLPALVETRLEGQLAANVDKAHELVRRRLFNLRRKQESTGRREIAEADIRKISPLRQLHFQ
jgi:hypothetical protein